MRRRIAVGWVLWLGLLAAAPVRAVPVEWTFSGATFADGGSASGSFIFDASTSSLTSWNIGVSGGNTGLFPAFTYDENSSSLLIVNAGNPEDTIFFNAGMAPTRSLRITPSAPLTDAGGVVTFDLSVNAANDNVECFNCSPFRFISAGSLVGVPVVAPAGTAAPAMSPYSVAILITLLLLAGRRQLLRHTDRASANWQS